jgi:hypothetical protein
MAAIIPGGYQRLQTSSPEDYHLEFTNTIPEIEPNINNIYYYIDK